MLTANIVSDSCADAHYGHELWSDNRRLKTMRTNLGLPRVALRQLDPPRQRIVLDLEETLQKTRWHIAHSRRLLEATTRLKDLVGSA